MLVVALVGIVVNLAATLRRWRRRTAQSLNVEGAFQHILTDLAAFIATAIAGVVILATGFDRADGDRLADRRRDHAARRLRPAARLGPRVPRGGAGGRRLRTRSAARWPPTRASTEVHDLHVWEVTLAASRRSPRTCSSAPADDCHEAGRALERLLHERFGIEHTTLQVDHEGGDLLHIESEV